MVMLVRIQPPERVWPNGKGTGLIIWTKPSRLLYSNALFVYWFWAARPNRPYKPSM
jgi:hypothetical protein